MSNTGVNTNTFRLTGKYIDLLNDFIVQVKLHNNISEARKDQVIDFISQINNVNNFQPQFQLLSSIIEREIRSFHIKPEIYLGELVDAIRGNNVQEAVPKLEFIIEALDEENSEALAKIKGE